MTNGLLELNSSNSLLLLDINYCFNDLILVHLLNYDDHWCTVQAYLQDVIL